MDARLPRHSVGRYARPRLDHSGMRPITDLLKDIPLSAVIREKLSAVEQDLEQVKKERQRAEQERHDLSEELKQSRALVDKLNARLVALESPEQLDELEVRLLRLLSDPGTCRANAATAGQLLGISRIKAEYHLTHLEREKFVHAQHYYTGKGADYSLHQRGREYLVKAGLD